uniref:Uncharacterized protein n=1 Tax=Spironucleus salmonicida TaxID=348837 RepID=V6LRF9_9EUKA|eukprot:EST46281.1 Hypothetical protein SS50377_13667 [Spironucleus salmonicida]
MAFIETHIKEIFGDNSVISVDFDLIFENGLFASQTTTVLLRLRLRNSQGQPSANMCAKEILSNLRVIHNSILLPSSSCHQLLWSLSNSQQHLQSLIHSKLNMGSIGIPRISQLLKLGNNLKIIKSKEISHPRAIQCGLSPKHKKILVLGLNLVKKARQGIRLVHTKFSKQEPVRSFQLPSYPHCWYAKRLHRNQKFPSRATRILLFALGLKKIEQQKCLHSDFPLHLKWNLNKK